MKSLSRMKEDVEVGDLVKVIFEKMDYVGYVCSKNREKIESLMGPNKNTIYRDKERDIILYGLHPYGKSVDWSIHYGYPFKFIGIDLSKKTCHMEPVRGYEVIRRCAV